MSASHDARDLALVLSHAGKVVIGLGALFAIPLATSLLAGEWGPAADFLLGMGLSLSLGFALSLAKPRGLRSGWLHGMAAASLSWLLVTVLAAVPYSLSGHYASFLDAAFDAMSGFTTTGLALIQDMDHASVGLTMWRHVLTFVGGQGIVVLALAFLAKEPGGGYSLYVGEGKDERLFPSVLHTARAIWKISLVYLVLGTAALAAAGLAIGLGPGAALLHGLWIFMSAWSTGGFAPMSQNILYYHSGLYEILSLVLFTLGSLNFALHHAMWSGNRREALRNLETRTLAASLSVLALAACLGLIRAGVYPDALALFRKGFYLLASGHTTTGLMSVYARQFALEWGSVPLLLLIFAMLVGGSACSTAGGFKGLRVGLVAKAVARETKRLLSPPSAVVERRYWYHGLRILDDGLVRNALLVVVLYSVTFGLTALATLAGGYPFLDAAFEAASVTGNVGLSIGVTGPSMPSFLKVVYIVVMWLGRLEFMAAFALAGYLLALIRRRA